MHVINNTANIPGHNTLTIQGLELQTLDVIEQIPGRVLAPAGRRGGRHLHHGVRVTDVSAARRHQGRCRPLPRGGRRVRETARRGRGGGGAAPRPLILLEPLPPPLLP